MLSPRRLGFLPGFSSRPTLLETQDAGWKIGSWGAVRVAQPSDFGSLAIKKFFFSLLVVWLLRRSKQNPKKPPNANPLGAPTPGPTHKLAMRACVGQQTRTLRPHYWALAIIWNCKSFIHGRGIRKWKIYVLGPDKSIGAPKHARNSRFKWTA